MYTSQSSIKCSPSPKNNPPTPKYFPTVAAMASSGKLSAAFLLLLLCSSTFGNATDCGCTPATPTHTPTAPIVEHCPRDALKLAVCANVLGLVNVTIGDPVTKPCCTLIKGLADLEAAACLCTAIKANILGNNLVIPVALSVLLSACQKTIPPGFQCV